MKCPKCGSKMTIDGSDAEEMYNDPGDEHLVQEFKDQDKYAEGE